MDLTEIKSKIKARNNSNRVGITLQVITVQAMVDEIERLRDALDDARDIAEENALLLGLLNERDFHENWDASKEHAAELIQRELQNRIDDLEAHVGELAGALDSIAELAECFALTPIRHYQVHKEHYENLAALARARGEVQ
jgi:hypothetical protein